jgi:hypothetical protein
MHKPLLRTKSYKPSTSFLKFHTSFEGKNQQTATTSQRSISYSLPRFPPPYRAAACGLPVQCCAFVLDIVL